MEDCSRLISANFEYGRDWWELIEVLDKRRQTAQFIIRKFIRTGKRETRRRGGAHATKMDEEIVAALVRYAEKKPTYTLEEIGGQAHLLERPENDSSNVDSEDTKTMRRDYGN